MSCILQIPGRRGSGTTESSRRGRRSGRSTPGTVRGQRSGRSKPGTVRGKRSGRSTSGTVRGQRSGRSTPGTVRGQRSGSSSQVQLEDRGQGVTKLGSLSYLFLYPGVRGGPTMEKTKLFGIPHHQFSGKQSRPTVQFFFIFLK